MNIMHLEIAQTEPIVKYNIILLVRSKHLLAGGGGGAGMSNFNLYDI